MVDELLALDKGHESDDFVRTRAFDNVAQVVVLICWQGVKGVSGTVLHWFCSFLLEWFQRICEALLICGSILLSLPCNMHKAL